MSVISRLSCNFVSANLSRQTLNKLMILHHTTTSSSTVVRLYQYSNANIVLFSFDFLRVLALPRQPSIILTTIRLNNTGQAIGLEALIYERRDRDSLYNTAYDHIIYVLLSVTPCYYGNCFELMIVLLRFVRRPEDWRLLLSAFLLPNLLLVRIDHSSQLQLVRRWRRNSTATRGTTRGARW